MDTVAVTVVAPPVLVGAGDIADCTRNQDSLTANLMDTIPGTVFADGDNAYPDGSSTVYKNCYNPTWGRFKARTKPVPGNHDYLTSGASGYFNYFGSAAGASGKGYYSYDLGTWHVVALNSNIAMNVGSPQEVWLKADLAKSTKRCTLAYWHHPLFSSGNEGAHPETQPLFQDLYDAGAEVVVVGHDHDYERFAPQSPNGVADSLHGIRE
ncbi:MAG: alkaline phosphatase, partial [Gemmatimonadetes bacterium]